MKYYRVNFHRGNDWHYITYRAASLEALTAFCDRAFSVYNWRIASAAEVRQTKARGCMILTLD